MKSTAGPGQVKLNCLLFECIVLPIMFDQNLQKALSLKLFLMNLFDFCFNLLLQTMDIVNAILEGYPKTKKQLFVSTLYSKQLLPAVMGSVEFLNTSWGNGTRGGKCHPRQSQRVPFSPEGVQNPGPSVQQWSFCTLVGANGT